MPNRVARAALRQQLRAWLVTVLETANTPLTLPEVREHLWPSIPPEIRNTSEVLWIGHELSRTLRSLEKEGLAYHHSVSQIGRWGLANRRQFLPPPEASNPVRGGEQQDLW